MKYVPLVLLFIINLVNAQTTHEVALVGMSFSPKELTIEVNDAVKWTNNGGLHNVVADDNSFTSGATSTSIWEFTHTFDAVGVYGYYCSEHGSPGSGMFGTITVESPTGVDDDLTRPEYKLKQNYPNPFNPKTIIEYSLSKSSYVTLKVFNVTGSLEKTLIAEHQSSGNYLVEFTSEGLTSGIYFYQLSTGDFISTKRMILLK
ncbi:MAG: T9SS C-terminal target domain-containing protein [Ignavibacteriales bacterium]|nr:MAG: T9SS C-terminal target domain-containing protein [Ignavibacteriales bacterium]